MSVNINGCNVAVIHSFLAMFLWKQTINKVFYHVHNKNIKILKV